MNYGIHGPMSGQPACAQAGLRDGRLSAAARTCADGIGCIALKESSAGGPSGKLAWTPHQAPGTTMTAQPFQELLPAQRRRVIFRVVLRGVLSAAVLAVLYYLLPLDEPWNGDTAVRLDVLRD